MTELTWQRLANGDHLCREHPIRLVKPISRRADDPDWLVRTPWTSDPAYADTDGWQWSFPLGGDTKPLEAGTLAEAKAMVESPVYLSYILGWIPIEYPGWSDAVRQRFVDAEQATADKFAAWSGQQPAQPRRRRKRPAKVDPYEQIGVRRPNANGWPILLELSSVQFAALMEVAGRLARDGAVAARFDNGHLEQPMREIHVALTNLAPAAPRCNCNPGGARNGLPHLPNCDMKGTVTS